MKAGKWVLSAVVFFLAATPAVQAQEIFDLLRKGDVAAARSLVEKDPRLVDARDKSGLTPLHYTAYGRDAGLIHFLVDKGAKLEVSDAESHTPLHIAAMNDKKEAVAALLKRGAAIEARDDFQRTPLILCARERGQVATVRVLIEAGADVNAVDKFGSDSLELAAWRGKGDVVDLLLEKGAKLPEPGEKWYHMLFQAASQGLDRLFRPLAAKVRDLKAAAGERLLHTAAEGGSAAIIGLLLDQGFDPAKADRFGWTPLHYASRDGESHPYWVSAAVIDKARQQAPAATEIVARCAQAMGGEEAIKNLKTMRFHPVYPDHGSSPIPIEIMRPNLSRSPRAMLVFDGKQACFLKGADGKSAPQWFSGEDIKDCEVEIGWFFPAFFDHPSEYAGSETLSGKGVHKLRVALPLGARMTYYIDAKTNLVSKAVAELTIGGKEHMLERVFSDYRSVGGFTFPHGFTYQGRKGVMNGRMEKIELNVPFAEDAFRIPAEAK